MPQRISKRLGKNALVSTLFKNVTPVQPFRDAHPNDYRIKRGKFTVNALVDREDGKKVLQVSHEDHEGVVFTILPGNCRLDKPGPPNQYFNQPQQNQAQQRPPQAQQGGEDEPQDDVEPVEDGVPNEAPPSPNHGWIWEEFSNEMTTDWRGAVPKTDASMTVGGLDVKKMSPGQFFDAFFPWCYVRDELMPATNAVLEGNLQKKTYLGEMKSFFGLWVVISLNPGYQIREFFIMPKNEGRTRSFLWNPPYLGDVMSRARFDALHSATRLRNADPPVDYRDKFWHIRPLTKAFNNQMSTSFNPSWLTCLDESMVIFFNAFAPGWMNVKRKPHPFGNEYHTIACADTHIIFYIEIVEGKDKPSMGPDSIVEFLDQWEATPSLVLRMTKNIWGTQRVVLLDSGFGFLPCLQALKSKGLFGTCVIKKRAYWPAGTEGEVLLEEMAGKDVGTIRVRRGTKDTCAVWIAAMADSKHTGIMANTWGTTHEKGRKRKRRVGRELVEIGYGEYQHYYYYGRHAVDDNNNNRQGQLPFEEAYCSKRWDLRQLGFVLALAMTNAYLAYNNFVKHIQGEEPVTKANFQRELAFELVYNPETTEEFSDENNTRMLRKRQNIPPGCKVALKTNSVSRAGHELMRIEMGHGRWNGREFPKIKTDYSKCACSWKCGASTRTFCYCDFNLMLCPHCYGEHIACLKKANSSP